MDDFRNLAGWQVNVTGAGDDALVMLPGALGAVDAARHAAATLARARRVVSVDYPHVATMSELCDGLAGVLDALSIARADILGGSLGGYIAQCFVRRHPDRVRRLILSHTFVV